MIDQNDCKITIDYDFNYKHKDVPTVIVRLITAEGVKIVEIIQGKNIEGFLDLTSTLQDYGYKVVSVENIKELILENEQLRMRLAEIPDLLDKIDEDTTEGCSLIYCKARHDTLSELRRLLVD